MTVRWRCFPLHPDTPEEGQLLEELFNTTPEKIRLMIRQLQSTAQELGLPFGERTKTYNSRLAQELGLWAEDHDKGHQFHMGAFFAYFDHGLNIGEPSVLFDLTEKIGLDKEEAQQILATRSYKARVDQDWRDAKTMGITAVPTLVMGSHKIVGAQRFEILQQLVEINKVEKCS